MQLNEASRPAVVNLAMRPPGVDIIATYRGSLPWLVGGLLHPRWRRS